MAGKRAAKIAKTGFKIALGTVFVATAVATGIESVAAAPYDAFATTTADTPERNAALTDIREASSTIAPQDPVSNSGPNYALNQGCRYYYRTNRMSINRTRRKRS